MSAYLDAELDHGRRWKRAWDAAEEASITAKPGDIVELFCAREGSGVPTGDAYLLAGRLIDWGPGGAAHRFRWAVVEVPGAPVEPGSNGWFRWEGHGQVRAWQSGWVVGVYDGWPNWRAEKWPPPHVSER